MMSLTTNYVKDGGSSSGSVSSVKSEVTKPKAKNDRFLFSTFEVITNVIATTDTVAGQIVNSISTTTDIATLAQEYVEFIGNQNNLDKMKYLYCMDLMSYIKTGEIHIDSFLAPYFSNFETAMENDYRIITQFAFTFDDYAKIVNSSWDEGVQLLYSDYNIYCKRGDIASAIKTCSGLLVIGTDSMASYLQFLIGVLG